MSLAVFCAHLQSDLSKGLVEVRANLSRLVAIGAKKIVPHPSAALANLGRAVLFGNATTLAGRVGRSHPFFRGSAHPSTLDGFDALIGRLCLGRIKAVPELDANALMGSLVIFGGPVSTWEARLIFGSEGLSPLLGSQLPFSFRYTDRLPEAAATRTEPWELLIDGVARACEEALVITVLPMDGNNRLVSVAGLRGPGTRAIDLLLRNERLLDRLYRDTRGLTGWQFLAEVSDVVEDVPRSLREMSVRELTGVQFDSLNYLETMKRLIAGDVESIDKSACRNIILEDAGPSHGTNAKPRSAATRSPWAAAPKLEQESMSKAEIDKILELAFKKAGAAKPVTSEDLDRLRRATAKALIEESSTEHLGRPGRRMTDGEKKKLTEEALRILK